ncbi:MAG: L,D-transpeptidase [Patescibacteria group bacterium]|nr:L,D-transpeptidase [Patescibacteria group bacterium]
MALVSTAKKIAPVVVMLGFLTCGVPDALAQKYSPIGFSIGDYAGDFVKEKETGRIWYIDVNLSRRYQVTENDPLLLERLKEVAQIKPWGVIQPILSDDLMTIVSKGQSKIRGLVYDENAPNLIWHIQRRANRRHALRSNQDVLDYIKKATVVTSETIKEYPIAFADFDYSVKEPAKKPIYSPNLIRLESSKFIDVSLSEQRLRAYENGKLVNTFLISSGNRKFPTPKGEFSVLAKLPVVRYQWSYGTDHPDNYDLGNVPYNLRVMPHKYIHYAYWHNNFGHVMSHGCINVNLANIKWIYRWADEGVPVSIH